MKRKILIVEDAYPNRFFLEQSLADYECHFALNGEQMWAILGTTVPELILMDIGLPDEDGISLGRKLSHDERFRDIPVIYLTAHSDKAEIIAGIKSGACDYLIKPVDENLLRDRIARALEKRETEKQIRMHTGEGE